MPMKTVDNRTNVPPLDHVGVINETAKLACEERHTWGTPSVIQHSWLMLPGCFAEYWRHFCLFEARSPSEKPACWNEGKIYIVARVRARIIFMWRRQSLSSRRIRTTNPGPSTPAREMSLSRLAGSQPGILDVQIHSILQHKPRRSCDNGKQSRTEVSLCIDKFIFW